MKIVVVFEYVTINGGENSMLAAIEQIQSSCGEQVQIIAAVTGRGPLTDRLAAANVTTTWFSLHDENGDRLSRDAVILQLNAMDDMLAPDIIHGNSLSMARLLGAAHRHIQSSTVCHIRDIMKLSKAAAADVNLNDRLIAVSQATRDFHIATNSIQPERMEVIYNGVANHSGPTEAQAELTQTQPTDSVLGLLDKAARKKIRAELDIPPDAFVVLTVGQICLRKGLDTLAQAAVKTGQKVPDLHFVLVGERFSSKQESIEFEQRVYESFAACPALVFHALGFRSDVADLMSAADLLVHAARQEPLGRVLLEAANAELPIVATDVGGTAEIIDHETSGLLVPVDDVDTLADSIQRMHNDSELRRRLATNAKAAVERRFSIEQSTASLVKVWEQVLADRVG